MLVLSQQNYLNLQKTVSNFELSWTSARATMQMNQYLPQY